MAFVYSAVIHSRGSSLSAHSSGRMILVTAHFKEETVVDSSAVTNGNGDIVGDGEQADAFIGACLSAEEIDEDSFSACVLVGDETRRLRLRQ